jgi:putative FmdB family regulatory protein
MPTYEYLCQTCSHRFETWQKMTDDPLTVCPECGNRIRRVLYPAGVVFKGSGFYSTDHANHKSGENGHNNEHHDEHKEGDASKTTTNGEKSSGGETKSSESKPASSSDSGTSKPTGTSAPATASSTK